AILAFGVTTLWMNSYLSGAVSSIGGALVLGSVRRLRRGIGVRNSLLLGAGAVLLMNTRPFEGLALTLAALVYLAAGVSLPGWSKIAVPAGVVLAAGLA